MRRASPAIASVIAKADALGVNVPGALLALIKAVLFLPARLLGYRG